MSLYFITGNENKYREVRDILGQDIKKISIDLPEIQNLDPKVILQAKMKAAFRHKKASFLVEDVSFSLSGLHGLPGPLIKWFLQTIGSKGIYDIAKRMQQNRAQAAVIFGYAKNPREIFFFEAGIKGKVVSPRGKRGFGFDDIFIPHGYTKTYAQMSEQEKNTISMRRKALTKLKKFLEKQ